MNTIVAVIADDGEASSCGYCKSEPHSSHSNGLWMYHSSAEKYQSLIDRGWRRSGQYAYKPQMGVTCCPAYTIRLDAHAFAPSHGNKKAVKKLRRLLHGALPVASDSSGVKDDSALAMDAAPQSMDTSGSIEEGSETAFVKPRAEFATRDFTYLQSEQTASASTYVKGIEVQDSTSAKTAKKVKQPWVKQPKQQKNAPSDIVDMILSAEKDAKNWRVELVPAVFEQETFDVYIKYQMLIHKDKREKLQVSSFQRFLVDSPITFVHPNQISSEKRCFDMPNNQAIIQQFPGFGTFHQKYYLNDELIAVSVLDILPHCVSAVYFMYDPSIPGVRSMSMGVYSALRECAMTKQFAQMIKGLQYYYMGYYIHNCPKMRYKAQFKPSELLCPKMYTWHPVEACSLLLDVHKVARLSYISQQQNGSATPPLSDNSVYGAPAIASKFAFDKQALGRLKVFQEGNVTLLKLLPKDIAVTVLKDLVAFVELVGMDIARGIIYVI
ncbi:arginine-tRNA-protein transferase [Chytriomyces cf. hyalinus JEL632]|nr:arginine-tRNA-protein transferase [Chytriomyces cf. hyalinus JEL632]